MAKDNEELAKFMYGKDSMTLSLLICFFSENSMYLHPRELMRFRTSMTDEEWIEFKVEFWRSHLRKETPMGNVLVNTILRLLGDDRHTIKEVSEILEIPLSEIQAVLEG